MRQSPLRQAQADYTEHRGKAMGLSTLRLRWQLRRLPRHSTDQTTAVRRKVLRDELRDRGELAS